MDLDMAGSPMALVSTILKKAPELKIPVPIEELCIQLDISSIDKLTTKGFEGCLITDVDRFAGAILYNAASHPYRRRFAIAHELGHFLMPKHIPDQEGRFLCSSKDMTQLVA